MTMALPRRLNTVEEGAEAPTLDPGHLHAHAHEAIAPHGGRYEDILDAIGHTPLVAIPRMSPNPNVRILDRRRVERDGASRRSDARRAHPPRAV